ncbi:hypothetical protein PHMEG_00019816 [Phytophthora megakarya]|uniref:Uncharacterized protein n=1 Tax=Phytophthora megakarya TaxID=4795 RepID=A0A225VS74_9STRA|nr:hypothetical protein PHMEG_00019816 [Phytophthora megakarya]
MLTRGFRRQQKRAHLIRIWSESITTNQTIIAATVAAFIQAEEPPEIFPCAQFNFNAISNDEYIKNFCFNKTQVQALAKLFEMEGIRTRERTVATGVEVLYIVLYKLAVPLRWCDLERFFGRKASDLTNLFLHVLDYLDKRYHDLLYFRHVYAAQNLQTYADAVFDAGGFMQNVWAFVDGTVRGINGGNTISDSFHLAPPSLHEYLKRT